MDHPLSKSQLQLELVADMSDISIPSMDHESESQPRLELLVDMSNVSIPRVDPESKSQSQPELVVDMSNMLISPTDSESKSQPQPEVVLDMLSVSIPSVGPDNQDCSTKIKHSIMTSVLDNFHADYFRISLSLCSQALLWKTLKTNFIHNKTHTVLPHALHVLPSVACTLSWSMALISLILISVVYLLKCLCHFDKIKKEFSHHVRVNYLFAPWMSSLLLLRSSPFDFNLRKNIYLRVLFWALVVPIIVLDIKIYGQWFTKGKQFLSRVANPTHQLSVIANLIASNSAMYMGWEEIALCFFSLGMVHYLVLFVTLYQRLPGNNGLSIVLKPVFFLFIATPSMASLAWESIVGVFDNASKMLFFLSLFLFMSLVCRPTIFKKSMRRFSIAWWAYSFPLTIMALASIQYGHEVKCGFTRALMLVLSLLSILVTFLLIFFTGIKINSLFLGDNHDHDQSPSNDGSTICVHGRIIAQDSV